MDTGAAAHLQQVARDAPRGARAGRGLCAAAAAARGARGGVARARTGPRVAGGCGRGGGGEARLADAAIVRGEGGSARCAGTRAVPEVLGGAQGFPRPQEQERLPPARPAARLSLGAPGRRGGTVRV